MCSMARALQPRRILLSYSTMLYTAIVFRGHARQKMPSAPLLSGRSESKPGYWVFPWRTCDLENAIAKAGSHHIRNEMYMGYKAFLSRFTKRHVDSPSSRLRLPMYTAQSGWKSSRQCANRLRPSSLRAARSFSGQRDQEANPPLRNSMKATSICAQNL